MRIYTKTGDDGTTGQFYGGRVRKDETGPEAYGTTDEAVSAMGLGRALASPSDPLAQRLLDAQRDLFVVGAELATLPENRSKLEPGVSLVTSEMVEHLEARIDEVVADVGLPTEFVVPGGSPLAAAIDLARSIVRRAERRTVTHVTAHGIDDTETVRYLNRLADYLYVLARAAEASWVPSRDRSDEGA